MFPFVSQLLSGPLLSSMPGPSCLQKKIAGVASQPLPMIEIG
jgi:hypothetical protein